MEDRTLYHVLAPLGKHCSPGEQPPCAHRSHLWHLGFAFAVITFLISSGMAMLRSSLWVRQDEMLTHSMMDPGPGHSQGDNIQGIGPASSDDVKCLLYSFWSLCCWCMVHRFWSVKRTLLSFVQIWNTHEGPVPYFTGSDGSSLLILWQPSPPNYLAHRCLKELKLVRWWKATQSFHSQNRSNYQVQLSLCMQGNKENGALSQHLWVPCFFSLSHAEFRMMAPQSLALPIFSITHFIPHLCLVAQCSVCLLSEFAKDCSGYAHFPQCLIKTAG